MCGIGGFNWEDPELIDRMSSIILHRGPDDYGSYVGNGASLGNRRLSIQDLSKSGHMPMSKIIKNKKYIITFNGEIYNFKEIKKELQSKGYFFNTNTDTEIIIASYVEWGAFCCEKFNGMWSFALLDVNKKSIFMSRDRFGEKPFYYYKDNDKFIFGSEIKQILEHKIPRRVDKKVMSDYLYFSFVDHTNNTFFENIKKLPAGTFATYNLTNNRLDIVKYYSVSITNKKSDESLIELLKEGVRSRMVSDVPVSLSLSGGIDSSSICALIPSVTKEKIKGFSTVPEKGLKGDETELINKMIKKYPQVNLVKSKLSAKGFFQHYQKLIYHMEEPFFDYNPYVRWEINKTVHKNKYKVLLMGEGADEILGGYYPSASFYLKDLLKKFKLIKFSKEMYYSTKQPEKNLIFTSFIFLILPRFLRKVVLSNMGNKIKNKFKFKLQFDLTQRTKSLNVNSYKDHLLDLIFQKSLPHLLNCDDKMAMAHSVEVRTPFLDHRLVDFALNLPFDDYVNKGYRKYPLRIAMINLVPDEILFRRKKDQFAAPLEQYIRQKKIKERITEIFKNAKSKNLFDSKKYLEEYNNYLNNEKANFQFIMKGLWIEEWMRIYNLEN